MKANYHTHCSYCDGKEISELYIKSAIKKGFQALGFSSHAPLPWDNDWTIKKEQLLEYINEIKKLKSNYKDKIQIYLGLEIDFVPGLMSPADKLYDELELDYRIGSVHMLEHSGKYYGIDGPDKEFLHLLNNKYNGKIGPFAHDYYSALREMIRIGKFNILGHIDLIKKKNKKFNFLNENETWYKEEVFQTLKTLTNKNIILEINSGGIARGATDSVYPSQWILKEAVNLSLPIMINSDAHHPDQIDFYMTESENIMKDNGIIEKWLLLDNKWQAVLL